MVYANNVATIYGAEYLPSAWVVGPDGKIIWSGSPTHVSATMVEDWVKDLAPTKVIKELHKDLKKAVEAFDSGAYGEALTEAIEVSEGSDEEQVKADAKHITELVQKHVDIYTGKMKAARESGELVKLGEQLEEAAALFEGSEFGDNWEAELKELEKSDEYKNTVKAHEELEELRGKLNDLRPKSARKKLEKVAEKYPDTPAGKEAAELAKGF